MPWPIDVSQPEVGPAGEYTVFQTPTWYAFGCGAFTVIVAVTLFTMGEAPGPVGFVTVPVPVIVQYTLEPLVRVPDHAAVPPG
jgi:hypothetical protein